MTAGEMPGAQVGIVGDFDPGNVTHQATSAALGHAGVRFEWVPTVEVLPQRPHQRLAAYAGLFLAPASPYRSMDGALAAIRFARERGVPLVGTWGGFQHAIVEFARNVLGLEDADHAETSPEAERLVITKLGCSLVGLEQPVTIVPGTRAAALYGGQRVIEDYRCNYGVDPAYHAAFERAGLRLSGFGEDGELRIVELDDHPFFLATLFVPQMRSRPGRPHPVLAGFAAAVSATGAPRLPA